MTDMLTSALLLLVAQPEGALDSCVFQHPQQRTWFNALAMNSSENSAFFVRSLKLFGIFCAVVGLAFATIWTVRIGLADFYFHRHTLTSTERAVRLTPGRAGYYAHLAGYLRDINSPRAIEALRRAVALNPYDAAAWIRLGLRYEAEGHLTEASRCLHQASNVDQTFLPAWSLANFYFRRGNAGQFWYWIRQSSRLVPDDASPLFRLCWHFTQDGTLIARQLDLSRPAMQSQYLNFLISENRVEAVPKVALQLAASIRPQDTASLLRACDWLIAQHQPMASLGLWNVLAEQHRIPFDVISPVLKPSVTNSDFILSPTSIGFDWHLLSVTGINASREDSSGGLRLEFSGDQPESAGILTQALAVQPNTAYTFLYDYSTSGIAPGAGLTWKILDLRTNRVLAISESLSADNGSVGNLDFTVPEGSNFVRVLLAYQRALGTTRIEGSLALHKTKLATVGPLERRLPLVSNEQ